MRRRIVDGAPQAIETESLEEGTTPSRGTAGSETRPDPLPQQAAQPLTEPAWRLVLVTGSPGAVTRPRLPQNVACGFPALRSSEGASQHRESL